MRIAHLLGRSVFARNVAVLMSGTVLAQALATIATPILTRLYAPEEFGILGLFAASVTIATTVAALRYEFAIVLPADDDDAANILALALGVVIATSLFAAALVLVSGDLLASLTNTPELSPFLWWAPVYLLASGVYSVLNFWSTRRQHFQRLSISRVSRSVGVIATQVSAGLARMDAGGLVIGQVAGQLLASTILAGQVLRDDWTRIRQSVTLAGVRGNARKHSAFPKYSSPQALVNAISQMIPAFLFAGLFGPGVVGLYWFTNRLLQVPSELIGLSVRQVFFQRASDLHNTGGDVYSLLVRSSLGLAAVGLLPLLAITIGGPTLFAYIFGNEWAEAGSYARWLVLWWYLGFINPPSVMLIAVYGLQKVHAIYEILLFVSRVVVIYGAALLGDAMLAIASFSLVGAVFNLVLIWYVLRFSRSYGASVPAQSEV